MTERIKQNLSIGTVKFRGFIALLSRNSFLRRVFIFYYTFACKSFVANLSKLPWVSSIYLTGSMAQDLLVPGLSDIDFTILYECPDSEVYKVHKKTFAAWKKLKRRFPMLCELTLIRPEDFSLKHLYCHKRNEIPGWKLLFGNERRLSHIPSCTKAENLGYALSLYERRFLLSFREFYSWNQRATLRELRLAKKIFGVVNKSQTSVEEIDLQGDYELLPLFYLVFARLSTFEPNGGSQQTDYEEIVWSDQPRHGLISLSAKLSWNEFEKIIRGVAKRPFQLNLPIVPDSVLKSFLIHVRPLRNQLAFSHQSRDFEFRKTLNVRTAEVRAALMNYAFKMLRVPMNHVGQDIAYEKHAYHILGVIARMDTGVLFTDRQLLKKIEDEEFRLSMDVRRLFHDEEQMTEKAKVDSVYQLMSLLRQRMLTTGLAV